MPNIITMHKILDEYRNIVVKYDILGDGSPDEVFTLLFDKNLFLNPTRRKKVTRIRFALDGFSAKLTWAQSGTFPVLTLPKNVCCDFKFHDGIANTIYSGRFITGSIYITTYGLDLNKTGTIILYIQNRYPI